MTARNGDDERVRAAFDGLKGDDSRARSTYAGVLARTERPHPSLRTSPVFKLAAAAVVIVVAGATYRIGFVREARLTLPSEVVALTAWRPETDVLLAAPVKLLRAQTRLGESMIDLDTLTKGVLQ